MADTTPSLFDGITANKSLDDTRLKGLLHRVYRLMTEHRWMTLSEIQKEVGGSEAGVSARLRDLRKEKFGSHIVNRRRRGEGTRGLFEYQLGISK
ncbi:hypothetical protein LCGC14_2693060 [marine sediment metagenome]|uniref:HTH marR-type domain-containing protein n=1 Tax=marine sediment metagenome TaxID=412755 RepID=A0A0F9A5G6_9ZZZZ